MDVTNFLHSLLHAISQYEFVKDIDIKREAFILKGKLILKNGRYVHIYFNEPTQTTAFALLDKNQRIWGIDFDNIRGWHEHPFENPSRHIDSRPKTVEEIIAALAKVNDS